jgi:hypothetical protein
MLQCLRKMEIVRFDVSDWRPGVGDSIATEAALSEMLG